MCPSPPQQTCTEALSAEQPPQEQFFSQSHENLCRVYQGVLQVNSFFVIFVLSLPNSQFRVFFEPSYPPLLLSAQERNILGYQCAQQDQTQIQGYFPSVTKL